MVLDDKIDEQLGEIELRIKDLEKRALDHNVSKAFLKESNSALKEFEQFLNSHEYKVNNWPDHNMVNAELYHSMWLRKYDRLEGRVFEYRSVISFAMGRVADAKEYCMIAKKRLKAIENDTIVHFGGLIDISDDEDKGYITVNDIKKWIGNALGVLIVIIVLYLMYF